MPFGLTGLDGSFDTSGETVTAVLAPSGSCFNVDRDRARFTGTRSGGVVQMQSQPVSGQVITLTGTLTADGQGFDGSYSITGGCANGRTNSFVGRAVNLTGIWNGTFGSIPITIDMQMAAVPDDSAGYPVSGRVTFSNTACFANATITRRVRGRWLFPDIVSDTQRLELLGTMSQDLNTMYITYALVQGTCPELSFGDGRVVRQ